jgi:hypothetical protein
MEKDLLTLIHRLEAGFLPAIKGCPEFDLRDTARAEVAHTAGTRTGRWRTGRSAVNDVAHDIHNRNSRKVCFDSEDRVKC